MRAETVSRAMTRSSSHNNPAFYDHVTDSHIIAPTSDIVHTCLIEGSKFSGIALRAPH
jgi:hypothetical protein